MMNWRVVVSIWSILAIVVGIAVFSGITCICMDESDRYISDDDKISLTCGMVPFTIIAIVQLVFFAMDYSQYYSGTK